MPNQVTIADSTHTSRPALALGKAALLCASLFQIACSGVASKSEATQEQRLPQQADVVTPQSLMPTSIVVDIMLGTDCSPHYVADDAVALWVPVAAALQQTDVSFGNLEEEILPDGGEVAKLCSNSSLSSGSYAGIPASAGFDLLSLANNRTRDFGEEGRDAIMLALDDVGLQQSRCTADLATWHQTGVVSLHGEGRGDNALALILLATADKNGSFIDGQIHSNHQQWPLGPDHQAARLISKLTLAELPDGLLVIKDEGRITVKPSPAASASLGASP